MVKPLKILFTRSIALGILPLEWKSAIIVPVYKRNGKPNNCSSYRPVSLTSIVCKIGENLVHKQLLEYLTINHIIAGNQHGFFDKQINNDKYYWVLSQLDLSFRCRPTYRCSLHRSCKSIRFRIASKITSKVTGPWHTWKYTEMVKKFSVRKSSTGTSKILFITGRRGN